jgi:hypothetical protein
MDEKLIGEMRDLIASKIEHLEQTIIASSLKSVQTTPTPLSISEKEIQTEIESTQAISKASQVSLIQSTSPPPQDINPSPLQSIPQPEESLEFPSSNNLRDILASIITRNAIPTVTRESCKPDHMSHFNLIDSSIRSCTPRATSSDEEVYLNPNGRVPRIPSKAPSIPVSPFVPRSVVEQATSPIRESELGGEIETELGAESGGTMPRAVNDRGTSPMRSMNSSFLGDEESVKLRSSVRSGTSKASKSTVKKTSNCVAVDTSSFNQGTSPMRTINSNSSLLGDEDSARSRSSVGRSATRSSKSTAKKTSQYVAVDPASFIQRTSPMKTMNSSFLVDEDSVRSRSGKSTAKKTSHYISVDPVSSFTRFSDRPIESSSSFSFRPTSHQSFSGDTSRKSAISFTGNTSRKSEISFTGNTSFSHISRSNQQSSDDASYLFAHETSMIRPLEEVVDRSAGRRQRGAGIESELLSVVRLLNPR